MVQGEPVRCMPRTNFARQDGRKTDLRLEQLSERCTSVTSLRSKGYGDGLFSQCRRASTRSIREIVPAV
jgi:hypothetical protein